MPTARTRRSRSSGRPIAGDNAAAMDIAQNSTYRPAHRGTTPITAFYDFTLQIQRQVGRDTPRAEAPSRARPFRPAPECRREPSRGADPGQAILRSQVEGADGATLVTGRRVAAPDARHRGVRQRRLPTAAAAFDKVATIGKQFQPTPRQSFAAAAVDVAAHRSDQGAGLRAEGRRARSDTNSKFALGHGAAGQQAIRGRHRDAQAVHAAAIRRPEDAHQRQGGDRHSR